MKHKIRNQLAALAVMTAVTLRIPVTGSLLTEESFRPQLSEITHLALALELGVAPIIPATKPKVWVVHHVTGEQKETAPEPQALPSYTDKDAEMLTLQGKCTYKPDKAALLTAPLPFTLEQAPQVLIYHTHTSEAYTQTAGWTYAESDPLRTTQTEQSVIRVGQALRETLEAGGLACLHDTSFNDYPSYNGAYARSLEKVTAWVQEYPSLQILLDIHRDATEDANGNPTGETVTVNGETAARCMLVVGTDQGGLSHDGWEDNLSFALKLQANGEKVAPGMLEAIDLRTERFNQHLRPGALLIEIGSTGNTLPEAITAARLMAEIILRTLGK